jgi:phosphoribosylamine---glycine ligase
VRILIVGGGGREHALSWTLSADSRNTVLSAPGNPGMALLGPTFPVAAEDMGGIADLAAAQSVDMVVIGPEAPLVAGLADLLRSRSIPCFGPGRAAARLEGSKWFAKEVMAAAGVPAAKGGVFTDPSAALDRVDGRAEGFVLKADGLAAGKGVFLPETMREAEEILRGLFRGSLGESGRRVVVEERLEGPEVSILAVCSGTDCIILPPSRDHKRLGDGDTGPNTGGMGAVCPPPGLAPQFGESIRELVISPVLEELASRGMDYRGVLYAGLILTPCGPKVLEFNVRFGDPETQAVLPMLTGDLAGLMAAASRGEPLGRDLVTVREGACSTVVMASGGYPGTYRTGLPIRGIGAVEGALVFHGGTSLADGILVTSGGRVLAVSAVAHTLDDSLETVYRAVAGIRFEGACYRTDIGRTI